MSVKALQNYTFTAKYARYNKGQKRRNTWNEAINTARDMHIRRYPQIADDIRWAFEQSRQRRVLGSQRALQYAGAPIERVNARIFNCTVSYADRVRFFQEAFWLLLCGCGVGFSVQTHHIAKIPDFYEGIGSSPRTPRTYVIPDTIEGWADSLGVLLATYMPHADFPDWGVKDSVVFDSSLIRLKGSPLSSGAGKAPGPEPLIKALEKIRLLLERCVESGQTRLRSVDTYDILMHGSDAVLSGGVRRSASICIFSPEDTLMAKAKTGNWFVDNPQRGRSNNSALLLRNGTTRQQFAALMTSVREYGEPGFVWADSTEGLYNPCFHPDVRLATAQGSRRIEDLHREGLPVDVDVDLRAGKGDILDLEAHGIASFPASPVRLTQKNAEVFKVHTEHGHSLRVTAAHKFPTTRGRLSLRDMVVGDTILLPSAEQSFGNKGTFEDGLLLGLLTGDQVMVLEDSSAFIDLGAEDFEQADAILGVVRRAHAQVDITATERRQSYNEVNWCSQGNDTKRTGGRKLYRYLTENLGVDLNSLKERVPEFIWQGSREAVRGYLQGLFFADGSVNTDYRAERPPTFKWTLHQSNKPLLPDAQVLLGMFGIVSRVGLHIDPEFRPLPNGTEGEEEHLFSATSDLVMDHPNSITMFDRVGGFGRKSQRIARAITLCGRECDQPEHFLTTIRSIESDGFTDVYCLEQPETNTVIANGVVTGQCVEIGLYPVDEEGNSGFAFCNLCEINGKKCKTEEDFRIAARAAAIIGTCQAGYTDFAYLGLVSTRIADREALLGVSITGMMDSPAILFDPEVQRRTAQLIVEVNKEIAAKIGINQAARTTCVKPAGCQSPSTALVTAKGILTLGELGDQNGETWQAHNLTVHTGHGFECSSKFFVNGHAQTKKITTSTGAELECTPNHRFKVFRDGFVDWVRADQLIVGDHIPYVVGGYTNTTTVALLPLTTRIHPNSKWTHAPTEMNSDLAWFLGLYTGYGSNHKNGIRIAGNSDEMEDLHRAAAIVWQQFGLNAEVVALSRDGAKRAELSVGSVDLLRWLELNGLKKGKSADISIPKTIRCSSPEIIRSFVDGYWVADGSMRMHHQARHWCTISKTMAQQMLTVLRAIGQDCSLRDMPPNKSSKGTRMRYWIQEEKGRTGQTNKAPLQELFAQLDAAGYAVYTPDTVAAISDSTCMTLDIEVPQGNAYMANSYISHNTTSLVLGTASGIHAHHAKRYIRRIQANILEAPYQFYSARNPRAAEMSVWNRNGTDAVLAFCVETGEGARTRKDMDALTLLHHVKLTQNNWVEAGKVEALCAQPWLRHNVSNTITVKTDEWDAVEAYIFDNRDSFAGISLLSASGDLDYPQAPFTAIKMPDELVKDYGKGVMFASGVIVDGEHAFDGNLWDACDIFRNGVSVALQSPAHQLYLETWAVSQTEESIALGVELFGSMDNLQLALSSPWLAVAMNPAKLDWLRRGFQYAFRYFRDDTRKMAYALKEVSNFKLWCDLRREFVEVDYAEMIEETDETKIQETVACAGGVCDLV